MNNERNQQIEKCKLTAGELVVIGGGRPGGVARCGVVLGKGGNGWRDGTLLAGGGGGAVR